MKNIVMIVGSFREKSFNKMMAREIEQILGDRASVSFLSFEDIPYMNQDLEFPAPESVARVRAQVQQADGIWICTPEYNGAIPGLLKNLLDWLSRPLVKNDWKVGSAVRGKVVTISGAAGKSGAAGARAALKILVERISMKLVGGEGTGVVLPAQAFTTGEAEIPQEYREALQAQAEEFLAAIG